MRGQGAFARGIPHLGQWYLVMRPVLVVSPNSVSRPCPPQLHSWQVSLAARNSLYNGNDSISYLPRGSWANAQICSTSNAWPHHHIIGVGAFPPHQSDRAWALGASRREPGERCQATNPTAG